MNAIAEAIKFSLEPWANAKSEIKRKQYTAAGFSIFIQFLIIPLLLFTILLMIPFYIIGKTAEKLLRWTK